MDRNETAGNGEMPQRALVLGASGGVGGELARELLRAGWQVRGLKRGLGVPRLLRDGIEWLDGDALKEADVLSAAEGCAVIAHAVNPPGYRNWGELVLPMLANTLAAARQQGATILLPGTVYNYGPDTFPLIAEDAPQAPITRKGAIRVELERRLQAAAEAGELRVIIVRAGDFFGPQARNSWFSQGMLKPGRVPSAMQWPGRPGVGHQFAYLPDVARTMRRLLEVRERLPAFSRFNMAGHWDPDGRALAQAVCRVLQRRGLAVPRLKAFPWWLMRLAAPFVTTLRELLDMRYLWQTEVRMTNARLLEVLGEEPHTPLDEAIEATLVGMGCLAQR
ncbi:NAD-dependent epimerase/dehydratase family protein [Uliginosibacterium aquaticum]|nr:NAD-dependent epimerase/dehydratase family protein [Uliginosibacterium aquaticum]